MTTKGMENNDFQERVTAAQDLRDAVRETGQRLEIDAIGNIILYHGTSTANAEAIQESGRFFDRNFFAPSSKATEPHIKPKHGKNTRIMRILADPRDVEFSTGSGEFYVPTELVRCEDGVWRSPERAKPNLTPAPQGPNWRQGLFEALDGNLKGSNVHSMRLHRDIKNAPEPLHGITVQPATAEDVQAFREEISEIMAASPDEFLKAPVVPIGSARLRHRSYSKDEMLTRGADGHLSKGYERYIPLDRLDGLEPVPSNNESDDGEYHAGRLITQPIEVEFDSANDVYIVYGGNHRIAQARANGDTHILAFVQPDRSSGRDYIGSHPLLTAPVATPKKKSDLSM